MIIRLFAGYICSLLRVMITAISSHCKI